MSSPSTSKRPRSRLAAYAYRGHRQILAGTVVGLVLAAGVWLVFLEDLGARLATIGAFIAAILTPLITSVVNNAVQHHNRDEGSRVSAPEDEHVGLDVGVVFVSSVLALLVALLAIWLIPRSISSIRASWHQKFNTETVNLTDITLKDNHDMRHEDIATVSVPASRHQHLKIAFKLTNNNETTLCMHEASLKITGTKKDPLLAPATAQQILYLGKSKGPTHELKVQMHFEPESDQTCALDLDVSAAEYYK